MVSIYAQSVHLVEHNDALILQWAGQLFVYCPWDRVRPEWSEQRRVWECPQCTIQYAMAARSSLPNQISDRSSHSWVTKWVAGWCAVDEERVVVK